MEDKADQNHKMAFLKLLEKQTLQAMSCVSPIESFTDTSCEISGGTWYG